MNLRPIRKQKFLPSSLKLHYLETNNFWRDIDRKNFLNLLQFLVYAQSLDYQIDSLGPTSYRQVVFPVKDFLKYKKESDNYYQLKKLLEFFDELQTNSLIKFFSDTQYRVLVTISEVILEKGKQNSWIAKVWIAEELFYYAHPFLFPDFLKPKLRKLTKHELEVQFKIIQVFSSVDIQKTFDIKDFLQTYPSILFNQDKTKIKNYFIQLIQILQEYEIIDSKYTIISDGKLYQTDQLTPSNISEGFIVYIVYEKLSI